MRAIHLLIEEQQQPRAPKGQREKGSKKSKNARGAAEIVEITKSKLGAVLGKKIYLVSAVNQLASGGWTAEVEVIEEEHMISNFDVIGTYSTQFDSEGDLTNWGRKGFRKRE